MQCMANSQLQYVAVTVKMFMLAQFAKCELYSAHFYLSALTGASKTNMPRMDSSLLLQKYFYEAKSKTKEPNLLFELKTNFLLTFGKTENSAVKGAFLSEILSGLLQRCLAQSQSYAPRSLFPPKSSVYVMLFSYPIRTYVELIIFSIKTNSYPLRIHFYNFGICTSHKLEGEKLKGQPSWHFCNLFHQLGCNISSSYFHTSHRWLTSFLHISKQILMPCKFT